MEKIPVRCIKEEKPKSNSIEGFKIYDLEKLLNGNIMHQKTHRHNFYFILLIESGNGKHSIDFNTHTISKYNVFFLRPGQVHSLILSADSKGYIIQFTEDFFQARKFKIANSQQLNDGIYHEIKPVVSKIENEYINKRKDYRTVILSCLKILLIELSRYNFNSIPKKNHYNQQRLEELLELIEIYFKEQKTVAFYSEKMNLTTYQLNTITKALLGKTPSMLINEYVVLEAKRLLLATNNQVQQIAYLLGYEDVSYFIRFFKKNTSYSPEAFRKNFE
ncbi:AraC family transcriptional regulator [Aquimarina longa]|uniref:AraC family transcriptional regulator n=1 Tax=Aquimarina longa TaxID=1080221 RepID=UPI0007822CF3|nr:helix-turn-helix transcriptional regulator [Aquimarina longa]